MQVQFKNLAEVNQLGSLVGQYQTNTVRNSIICALFFGVILFFLQKGYVFYGLIFLVIIIGGIYQVIRNAGLQVILYDKGFIYMRRSRTQVVKYEEIIAIWQRMSGSVANS